MGKFENQLSRMQSLMTYGLVNESDNKSGNIEFSKVASDGKAYGIIRECNRFYIKVTDADKQNIVESYDYIGGFNNKKDYEYSSYQNALKNFDMKMMSINEATGVYGNATTLNPDKKKEFVVSHILVDYDKEQASKTVETRGFDGAEKLAEMLISATDRYPS